MNTASWLEGLRDGENWRALVARRGPGLAAGALALAVAAQAAFIVTGLAGGAAPPPADRPLRRPQRAGADLALIVRSHLFGVPPAVAGTDANAPRTSLPLVLTGVIAASDPSAGLAILGPSAQSVRVYAVGDSVPGGARLDAVLPQQVLLRRDGQIESLALPQESSPQAVPPSATAPTSAPVNAQAFVSSMQTLVSRRPDIVADLLRPEPVFAGGHQLGYRVYPGNNRAAFTRLGLEPGDLVMAINGTPLNDPSQDQQILSTLGSSDEASVTILRNGHRQTLTLNLAQVEQAAQSLTNTPPRAHRRAVATPSPGLPFASPPQPPH